MTNQGVAAYLPVYTSLKSAFHWLVEVAIFIEIRVKTGKALCQVEIEETIHLPVWNTNTGFIVLFECLVNI